MNYTELQQAIIDDSHRPDLSALIPRFIRMGEGLIRRELIAYPLSYEVTDSDRDGGLTSPVYLLPSTVNVIRSLRLIGRIGDGMIRTAPDALSRTALTRQPEVYAQYRSNVIEVRGNPPEGSKFELLYYGLPAPLQQPNDTNELLTDHESLYIAAGKFYVYTHTQDRELASDELEIFNGVSAQLNESITRQLGGNAITPGYNFTARSTY